MKMPQPKRQDAGYFPESDRQRLQMLYTQSAANYESVRSLSKANNLPASKARQLLHLLRKLCFGYTKIQDNEGFH